MKVENLPKYLIFICIYGLCVAASSAAQIVVSTEDASDESDQSASAISVAKLPIDVQIRPNPGDNFYLYANNEWLSGAEISQNALSAGSINQAKEAIRADVARLEADLLSRVWPEGSDEEKYQTVFNAFLDERRVKRRGLRPISSALRDIRSARNHEQIAYLLGSYQLDAGGLFRVSLKVSQQSDRAYAPQLDPARFMLGTADVYLREDAVATHIREEGAKLLAGLLRRGGGRFNTRGRVQAVLQLETDLARLAPTLVDQRDPLRVAQMRSVADLAKEAPSFPWRAYLGARGLAGDPSLNVAAFADLDAVARKFASTSVSVWRDYLVLRVFLQYGNYLPEDIALAVEQLRALRGGVQLQRRSRYERASEFAQWVMPEVLGQRYVETHVTPETLTAVEAMAERMRGVYRHRIERADWLSEQTRAKALSKLAALQFMIGVPPDWNDHTDFIPEADNLFGNAYHKLQDRHASTLFRLRQRPFNGIRDVDELRKHIFFSPLQVGAYYLPRLNAIVLPAAYLRSPFFDINAGPAYNYGRLGTTIGHELGHAFDDQGSKYGGTGALEDWWSVEDRARFEKLGAQLSAQFAGLEAVPGIALDTELTLGENLSDLVGVEMALAGFLEVQREQGTRDAADQKAELQSFFLSYAEKRRKLRRPETELQFSPRDRHSPPDLRTNVILPNIDAWYEAFGIPDTAALWLPPEQRLRVW